MASERGATNQTIEERWRAVFNDPSGAVFQTNAAPGVTLEGSAFLRGITGSREVWKALWVSAQIYDQFDFTHISQGVSRCYLEWTARGLGLSMAGVTLLTVNDDNRFTLVAIHHRPLSAALAFSVEMRRRLVASMDPTFFYRSARDDC